MPENFFEIWFKWVKTSEMVLVVIGGCFSRLGRDASSVVWRACGFEMHNWSRRVLSADPKLPQLHQYSSKRQPIPVNKHFWKKNISVLPNPLLISATSAIVIPSRDPRGGHNSLTNQLAKFNTSIPRIMTLQGAWKCQLEEVLALTVLSSSSPRLVNHL